MAEASRTEDQGGTTVEVMENRVSLSLKEAHKSNRMVHLMKVA